MNLQKTLPIVITGLVFMAALGGGGYFFYQKFSSSPNMNSTISNRETKALVEQLGKNIDLPIGEEPVISTITNIDKLKDQPFFSQAHNGDKVIIFLNSKKAILYDPAANKVLDVAPVNIGSDSASLQKQTPARVILRNGTNTSGLASKTETELLKTYSDLDVVSKDNAAKNDYAKTVIVVLNDTYQDFANKLADTLKASVAGLPSSETKPKDADILVIIGKDHV